MPLLPRNRTKSFPSGGQLSGVVTKVKSTFQKIRSDVKNKRPGVLIPKM